MNEHSARATLGVAASATPGEIKRAYRQRALQLHPDRGGDPAAFARIAEAQRLLLAGAPAAPAAGPAPRRRWFGPTAAAPATAAPTTAVPTTAARPSAAERASFRSVSGHRNRTGHLSTSSRPAKSFGDVLAEKMAAA